jgi:hypothetical protein
MRVIIAGSRSIKSACFVLESWKSFEEEHGPITEVVCGCAQGVDIIGAKIAKGRGIRVRYFPANWDRDGKRAGLIRNKRMALYADGACFAWDGKSSGTFSMIELATQLGLKVYINIATSSRIIQPWNLRAR